MPRCCGVGRQGQGIVAEPAAQLDHRGHLSADSAGQVHHRRPRVGVVRRRRGFAPTHNTQNSNALARQDSPKPEWEAQLSLGLDNCGEELGVLMVLEAGYPYRMKEFPCRGTTRF